MKLSPTQEILAEAALASEGHDPEERPFAMVVTVTPEMAGDWLLRNKTNRPLREITVKKYATIINSGRWRLNGDTIKFDKEGNLIDGQHRLNAIIVSDRPVDIFVVFNLESDTFATLDRPKKRSVADVLFLQGEVAPKDLGAALSWYWKYVNGRIRVFGPEGWAEPTDIVELLAANPGMRDSVRAVWSRKYGVLGGRAALAMTHYVLSQIDAAQCEKFFQYLATPAMLDEFNPIFRLRERFMVDRSAKNKMATAERIAITFKAWNAWRAGQDVKSLRWRSAGSGKEAFPKPE